MNKEQNKSKPNIPRYMVPGTCQRRASVERGTYNTVSPAFSFAPARCGTHTAWFSHTASRGQRKNLRGFITLVPVMRLQDLSRTRHRTRRHKQAQQHRFHREGTTHHATYTQAYDRPNKSGRRTVSTSPPSKMAVVNCIHSLP